MSDKLETVTDNLLGHIAALELLVAGLLSTMTHKEKEVATAFLEQAYASGIAAPGITESFLQGFESTRNRVLPQKT
ncbi:hypothetical protein G3N58_17735 [Paraburkholderia sp. Ac-20342]|uniref:hypothetical protein n=1 Tax=Paraburkholderia sp. Ac-20342 TaxID=2703889 RepID=UPI0019813ED3|nr:hypothetical protein [Paraburkholderia sp. Ac-20342]MBN3848650.1 hypothetical protein [Paraburkholderia sp. Ac-20342]